MSACVCDVDKNNLVLKCAIVLSQVLIECGTSNEVYAASEPNRCEYEYKFRSPAACAVAPEPAQRDPLRDEL